MSVAFLITEIAEFGMLCGAGLVSIALDADGPGSARLSVEVDALAGDARLRRGACRPLRPDRHRPRPPAPLDARPRPEARPLCGPHRIVEWSGRRDRLTGRFDPRQCSRASPRKGPADAPCPARRRSFALGTAAAAQPTAARPLARQGARNLRARHRHPDRPGPRPESPSSPPISQEQFRAGGLTGVTIHPYDVERPTIIPPP